MLRYLNNALASSPVMEQSRNTYIPELDGLRCLAVLSVIFFHLKIPGFGVGWIGVNLFFVLSGYLITSILLADRDLQSGVIPFIGRFYARRCLRIFPLYYGYLVLNYLLLQVLSYLHPAENFEAVGYGWYLTYTQNFLLGTTSFKLPGFLGHTWTLAIEEQFYLVWPLLVYCLSARTLAIVSFIVIIAGPISRHYIFAATGNPYLTFVATPGSMDQLAFGCLCALYASRTSEIRNFVLGFALCATVAVFAALVWVIGPTAFWHPQDWVSHPLQMYVFSAVGLMFSAVILSATRFRWSAILRSRLAVHLGRISYGMYMWHGLATIVATKLARSLNPEAFNPSRAVLAVFITYVVSWVSFRFFESPFLALKAKFYSGETQLRRSPLSRATKRSDIAAM